jgi:phage baseplate assembly protein W
MPTFIGFNTIGQNKKFTLTDFDLIKRDIANAFNIQQGTLPGRPGYGSNIWAYLFENQTTVNNQLITEELQRIISGDPRVVLVDLNLYPQDNGLRVELDLQVVPSTTAERLAIFFDTTSTQATLV